METKEITIRVTPEAATIYQTASEQERLKLDALLSLSLSETAMPSRSLEEIMREASREARERGLTEDALKEILDER
jgi:Cdc6-like AAA superfamily ATPase